MGFGKRQDWFIGNFIFLIWMTQVHVGMERITETVTRGMNTVKVDANGGISSLVKDIEKWSKNLIK